jgi:hypothetical protein
MIFGIITLLTALAISISAAVYSILGLTAIFAAAYWPIVILGSSLEFGKIITTLWLHKYWTQAEFQYKVYLSFAVVVLMVMTSMGVFGFLSKAHSDQGVPTGDIAAKIELIDTKITTQRENINTSRKVLSQMDGAVDEVLARSKNEQGARNANTLRQQQAKDRTKLADDIGKAQTEIAKLNEEKALVSKDLRKVEAEVGPIKYIAALIYGDNPDANVLEKSVRWVIILIVMVFDPLAITLLLAATKAFDWERDKKKKKAELEQDNNAYLFSKDEDIKQRDEMINKFQEENTLLHNRNEEFADMIKKLDAELKQAKEVVWTTPVIATTITTTTTEPAYDADAGPLTDKQIDQIKAVAKIDLDIEPYGNDLQRHAMLVWKTQNPDKRYKDCIDQFNAGEIDHLPWQHPDHIDELNLSDRDIITLKLGLEADNDPTVGNVKGFGTSFPTSAEKGDMFLRVDTLPSVLYKFNGAQWIKVNKNLSDSYVYDDAYIDHLIEKISSGEYDPDLLSDVERERISLKLKNAI